MLLVRGLFLILDRSMHDAGAGAVEAEAAAAAAVAAADGNLVDDGWVKKAAAVATAERRTIKKYRCSVNILIY